MGDSLYPQAIPSSVTRWGSLSPHTPSVSAQHGGATLFNTEICILSPIWFLLKETVEHANVLVPERRESLHPILSIPLLKQVPSHSGVSCSN